MRILLVACLIASMASVCLAEEKKEPTAKVVPIRAEDLASGKYRDRGSPGQALWHRPEGPRRVGGGYLR